MPREKTTCGDRTPRGYFRKGHAPTPRRHPWDPFPIEGAAPFPSSIDWEKHPHNLVLLKKKAGRPPVTRRRLPDVVQIGSSLRLISVWAIANSFGITEKEALLTLRFWGVPLFQPFAKASIYLDLFTLETMLRRLMTPPSLNLPSVTEAAERYRSQIHKNLLASCRAQFDKFVGTMGKKKHGRPPTHSSTCTRARRRPKQTRPLHRRATLGDPTVPLPNETKETPPSAGQDGKRSITETIKGGRSS